MMDNEPRYALTCDQCIQRLEGKPVDYHIVVGEGKDAEAACGAGELVSLPVRHLSPFSICKLCCPYVLDEGLEGYEVRP